MSDERVLVGILWLTECLLWVIVHCYGHVIKWFCSGERSDKQSSGTSEWQRKYFDPSFNVTRRVNLRLLLEMYTLFTVKLVWSST